MANTLPSEFLVTSLAAAYTKALCHNPQASIHDNMSRALMECPTLCLADNAIFPLLSALELAVNDLEVAVLKGFKSTSLPAILKVMQPLKTPTPQ